MMLLNDRDVTSPHATRGVRSEMLIELGATGNGPVLTLRLGSSTQCAGQKVNEDFHGIVTANEEPEAAARGVCMAIADGTGSDGTGRIAAELAVRTVLRDFYATSPEWNVGKSIDCVLRSVNDWLVAQNAQASDIDGMVTTFSMLLLKGDMFCLAHVGDTRVYRKRGAVLRQLSVDHTWPRRNMRHVLKRAIGLDTHLVVDFAEGELRPGDMFIMVSDGVWEVLGEGAMREILGSGECPDRIANDLTQRSMRNQAMYMGRNDATALVAMVDAGGG